MLIALLTALLFGGGDNLDVFGKQHYRYVREVIADEAVASAVVDEMKATQKSFDGVAKEARKLTKRWRRVDADRAARRDELEPLIAEADANRERALDAFTETIFALREKMSAEEWETVYGQLAHPD